MKKPDNATNTKKKITPIQVTSFLIRRAVCVGKNNNVLFDMELNGVTIYGCSVVEGKNGDFIGFPSKQGNDKKYYSVAYAPLSEEDQKEILAAVEAELNK